MWVGCLVGFSEGTLVVGFWEGALLVSVGVEVGREVGWEVGREEGEVVGWEVGRAVRKWRTGAVGGNVGTRAITPEVGKEVG